MSTNNFSVYTKNGCPYCTKVTSVLKLAEQSYIEYKLGRDFEKEEFYNEFGEGSTFPQITVDGKNLGGCVETVKYLRESNLV
jgi:glutaredoxin